MLFVAKTGKNKNKKEIVRIIGKKGHCLLRIESQKEGKPIEEKKNHIPLAKYR